MNCKILFYKKNVTIFQNVVCGNVLPSIQSDTMIHVTIIVWFNMFGSEASVKGITFCLHSRCDKLFSSYKVPSRQKFYKHRIFFHVSMLQSITKTCLYNFDPLKPHFYVVKLGFTGVYIIFLISAQKHRLWVLVRTASLRRFQRVPTIYILSRNMKNIRFFFIWNLSFCGGKIFSVFE